MPFYLKNLKTKTNNFCFFRYFPDDFGVLLDENSVLLDDMVILSDLCNYLCQLIKFVGCKEWVLLLHVQFQYNQLDQSQSRNRDSFSYFICLSMHYDIYFNNSISF